MTPQTAGKSSIVLQLVVALILCFILSPLVVVVISSFGKAAFLHFPPQSYSWRWYTEVLSLDGLDTALMTSLQISGLATPISIVIGTCASLALARHNFTGKPFVVALLLSPLVVPGIVIGIAMLQFLRSMLVVTTFQGLLIAHIAITLPYMVRTVAASLEMEDNSALEAARMLGANGVQTFWYVTLPSIKSAMFAGGIFVFITSFDNYAISLFLSDASTTTLPIKMLEYIETRTDPAIAALSSS